MTFAGITTDENGLYYMRARYYNPNIKHFINQDIKIGDIGNSQSLNRYAYCEGNPVSYIDPFGLSPQSSQDQGKTSRFQFLHNIFSVGGFVWDGFDILDVILYSIEGDYVNAGISLACCLPVIGIGIAATAKSAKVAKNIRKVDYISDTIKAGNKVQDGLKAVCVDQSE